MREKNGFKKWQEHLTDSGRIEMLKEKKPKDLQKEFGLSTEFFRKEKKRLLNRPKERGKNKIKKLPAQPTKKVILNKAKRCSPKQAFCEILDNIFDNFEEEKGEDLEVSIEIYDYMGTDEIIIRENSGGINNEKQIPLVRLGEPKHVSEGSIGTWGEGFKIAAASLGKDVKVYTHYPGEQAVLIHIDEYWWDSDDWEVPVYSAEQKDLSEGSSIFIISKLNLTRNISGSEMADYLGEIYGHKLKMYEDEGKNVTVKISAEEESEYTVTPKTIAEEEDLKNNFAFVPYFRPIEVDHKWKKGERELNAKFIIGLTPRQLQETSGVTMFGNGRRFAKAITDKSLGYGSHPNSRLPRQHPSIQRLHIFIFFNSSNPENIPWQAPLKDGYYSNNAFNSEIREAINKLAPRYVIYARHAKEHDIIPFSKEWESLSEEKRLDMLLPSVNEEKREEYKDNKIIKELLNFRPDYNVHKIKRDEINLDKIPFDESKAREIKKMIKYRNKSDTKIDDLDFLKIMLPEISSKDEEDEKDEDEDEEDEDEDEEDEDEDEEDEDEEDIDFGKLDEVLAKKTDKTHESFNIKVPIDDMESLREIYGKKSNKKIVNAAIKDILVLKTSEEDEESD